ncbi:PAS domain-containing protein [Pseudomonas sp. DC3000-4b1]|uniref:hybrid sensor histidine kinase/response regulator n=1 Tax=unclassified Pseudomonas TaxID=196821 RepID=UPI003CEE5CC1
MSSFPPLGPAEDKATALTNEAFDRLRLALDAGAIIGTWIWDIQADRVTADERFSRSFGIPAELCQAGLALDQTTRSIHPEDLPRVFQTIEQALDSRGLYRCEYRIRGTDGQYRWIEASGRVETDDNGTPVRFPGILLDIDARRAAETERDRANALLRMFTEAVPGVVYAKDRQGRMLVANRGTTALIGKPPEEYLGKTDKEFLQNAEQARIITETDQRIMNAGVGETIEEQVSLPDGTVSVWLSTKAPLFDDAGQVIGLIGSSIDVTDRKNAEAAVLELNTNLEQRVREVIQEREQAQEALRQSQKMEAVGQLTGGIAHDFNNLLGGISGCLEMMRARMEQGRFDELERYLTVALGAVQRGTSLTHRLLAFSRRQVLAPKPTDVNALIIEMEELVRRAVGPSVELQTRNASGLWPALIDPGQLENALLNLCINARDAMPNGGRITLEAANETVDEGQARQLDLPAAEYLRISVKDTGLGMSAELLQKVFEPFFTTKPLGEGTGLGLSMVYGFARQSGGQVQIASEVGRGTRVSLYLPRYEGQLPSAEAVSATLCPLLTSRKDMTVLIVEDDAAARMLLTEVVQDLGYAVIEASDSVAGTRILESDVPIDLLITDIGLPGGCNGLDMVSRCQDQRKGLKVLFITGYTDQASTLPERLGHNARILTKPFALDAMRQCLRDFLEA